MNFFSGGKKKTHRSGNVNFCIMSLFFGGFLGGFRQISDYSLIQDLDFSHHHINYVHLTMLIKLLQIFFLLIASTCTCHFPVLLIISLHCTAHFPARNTLKSAHQLIYRLFTRLKWERWSNKH